MRKLLLSLFAMTALLFVLEANPVYAAPADLDVAAAFDAVENGLHAWLTAAPRFGVPSLYAASAGAAGLKWLLLLAFALLVVAALARTRD